MRRPSAEAGRSQGYIRLWFMFGPISWLLLFVLLLFTPSKSDGPPCIPAIPLSWDIMFCSEPNWLFSADPPPAACCWDCGGGGAMLGWCWFI